MGFGFAFGLAALMAAVESAGSLADVLAGFSFGSLINPMDGNQAGPLSQFYSLVGTMIFLAIGGEAWVLRGLARTFQLVPLTSAPRLSSLVGGAEQVFAAIFVATLEIAAPVVRRADDHRRRLRRGLARGAAAQRVRRRLPRQGGRRAAGRRCLAAVHGRLDVGSKSRPASRRPSARCTWPRRPRMAQQDRTEKATPKHREKAREKGQVARSADAGGSLVMVAGLFGLSLLGPQIITAAAESFKRILAEIAHPAQATSAAGLARTAAPDGRNDGDHGRPDRGDLHGSRESRRVSRRSAFTPRPRRSTPDFRRINPISGMRNLFSPNLVFEALKAVTKVSAVAAVAALAVVPGMGGLVSLVGITPGALGNVMGQRAMSVAQHAAYAYLAIGVIDYIWQRHRHAKQLRMTKQEVKDEQRQYSVSAEVRSAQRRRQMQAARARMMAAVPEADVVVTNPTHYAVALRYDGMRAAPEVVAKGQDLIAAQIRKVAEENDVPVIPDPPLARALHSSTEIGQVIPEELYAAVAQVLAFVYRLAARRRRAV